MTDFNASMQMCQTKTTLNNSIPRWFFTGVLVLSAFFPNISLANNKFLNVQGKLTDTSGNPLTGNQTVTFRLYTSSTGGSAFWTESQTVSLSTGLFNVTLGTSTALDPYAFNQLYYLSLQVAGDANELSPRQVLGGSSYAQASLGDFYISGQAIIAGTTTVNGSAFSIGSSTFVVAGGNVGVGTSSPASLLDVNGNSAKGATFAVGGSTFNVTGGKVGVGTNTPAMTLDVNGTVRFGSTNKSTFTATGLLQLAPAGVQWADGSTSTTSAGGIAYLTTTGSYNLTGSWTWLAGSTIAINSATSISGTVITVTNHPVCSGIDCVIVSTTPANQVQITIAGLEPNSQYELRIDSFTQLGSNAMVQIRFGTSGSTIDSTSGHYAWRTFELYGAGSTGGSGNTSDSKCNLSYGDGLNDLSGPGAGGVSKLTFHTYGGNMPGRWSSEHYDSVNSRWSSEFGGCDYLQSPPVTNVTILVSAGSFTATVKLIKKG